MQISLISPWHRRGRGPELDHSCQPKYSPQDNVNDIFKTSKRQNVKNVKAFAQSSNYSIRFNLKTPSTQDLLYVFKIFSFLPKNFANFFFIYRYIAHVTFLFSRPAEVEGDSVVTSLVTYSDYIYTYIVTS